MRVVARAIATARSEGAVLSIVEGGLIDVMRPEPASERLAAALEAIRQNRDAALALLRRTNPPPSVDPLKGSAVLLVSYGRERVRCWIVADAEDAARLRPTIEPGDTVLERPQVREVVLAADQETVRSILEFKRLLPGRIRSELGHDSPSRAPPLPYEGAASGILSGAPIARSLAHP